MTNLKKMFTMAVIVIAAVLLVGANYYVFAQAEETEVETETEFTRLDDPWFEDATEFDKYEWPTSEFSLSRLIPETTWSPYGQVDFDIDSLYMIRVGYSTPDDMNKYIELLQDEDICGFTLNQHIDEDFRYHAEDEEGRCIDLLYNGYNQFLSIELWSDNSNSEEWWLETETEE